MWFCNKTFKVPDVKVKKYSNKLSRVVWSNNDQYKIIVDHVDLEKVCAFRDFIEHNLDPLSAKINNQNLWYGENLKNMSLNKLNDTLLNKSQDLENKYNEVINQQIKLNEVVEENNKVNQANINNNLEVKHVD